MKRNLKIFIFVLLSAVIFSGCSKAPASEESEKLAIRFVDECFSDFSSHNDPSEFIDVDSNLYKYIMDKREILDFIKSNGKFNGSINSNYEIKNSHRDKDGLDVIDLEAIHNYTKADGAGGIQTNYRVYVDLESKKVVAIESGDYTSDYMVKWGNVDWQKESNNELPYNMDEAKDKAKDFDIF